MDIFILILRSKSNLPIAPDCYLAMDVNILLSSRAGGLRKEEPEPTGERTLVHADGATVILMTLPSVLLFSAWCGPAVLSTLDKAAGRV